MWWKERPKNTFPYLLMAPTLAVVAFVFLYPLASSLYYSFLDYKLLDPRVTFVYLQNYMAAFSDPIFRFSLGVTAYFAALYVAATVLGGLCAGLLLNEDFRGQKILRTLCLIPWAISPVVNGLLWIWIYNGKWGLLNAILQYGLGIISSYQNWLDNPFIALNLVAFAMIWKDIPFVALVAMGSLQGIREELYEAAKIDGASALQRFRNVTLPGIMASLITVVILESIWAIRAFDTIYVITKGGPMHRTAVLGYYVYEATFERFNIGYGAALGYILTLLTLILTVFYLRRLRD